MQTSWLLNKVPKIAHFYWGGSRLSWLRYLTIKSFNQFNSDWQIKFYYPKKNYVGGPVWNQGYAEQVTGEDWFSKLKDIPNVEMIELDFETSDIGYIPDVFRSDILRLKWLGDEGGLYADMDILFFKPLNNLCFNRSGYQSTDTIISYNPEMRKKHYSIGFLMSSPNNHFYKYLYQRALLSKNERGEYQHLGIKLWHQHFPEPRHISERFPELSIYDISMSTCYYHTSFEVTKFIVEDLPFNDPRTIAFHWYGGHPDCVHWESTLTPDNYMQFNNTICSTIKRVLL